jgi:uncharacterized protein YggE
VNPILIIATFIAIGVLATASFSLYVNNNNNDAYARSTTIQNVSASNSTLYVMGNAQTMVKADKVTLSLSVETTNETANEALIANSEAINNALRATGVRENETRTSFFNISPNYNITQDEEEDFPPVESKDIISYTVTNSITIDSYNLLNVSQWIDTAVQSGVNDISSVYFSLSDEKSELIKNDLLKQAVTNAKSKADIAASALGLKVIGVKSVNVERVDGISPLPSQPLFKREAVGAAAPEAGPPTPIIAGEQQITSSIGIAFLIGDNL